MSETGHKAGFVSIIGLPNAGKSTLMNLLVGEKLSIITYKAQTTRHRIMGIINEPDYQIVYSDTPGILEPVYELHKSMMHFVNQSLEDADVLLFIHDATQEFDNDPLLDRLKSLGLPIIFVLNKIDKLKNKEALLPMLNDWQDKLGENAEIVPVSALKAENTDKILPLIKEKLPEHPPFYDKDALTDKPEKFFAAEIVREKIFLHYDQEIPYSCEVVVESFKEEERIIRIAVVIYVERKSQKGIIIGHRGESIKKVGTEARLDMEAFFGKKVFLEQFVKVDEDWRKNALKLKNFGYKNK